MPKTFSDLGPESIRILSSERAYDGFCTVDVYHFEQQCRDGRTQVIEREVHHHGNAVGILPVNRERRTVLLCRQFRASAFIKQNDPFPLEVCAGQTHPESEDPQDAIRREAMEELGVEVSGLDPAGYVYSSPGLLGERTDLFVGTYQGRPANGGGGLVHEGEDIEVVELTCKELSESFRAGNIRDSKTVILVQHLMLNEPELFAEE